MHTTKQYNFWVIMGHFGSLWFIIGHLGSFWLIPCFITTAK